MSQIVCVKCDSVLDRTTVAGMEVDLCPQCGGLWLDKGEVERLGKAPDAQVGLLRKQLLGDSKQKPTPSDLTTACPACSGKLREVRLNLVHVDFCTQCGGFWLDKGELESTLAATRGKGDVSTLVKLAIESTGKK